MLEFNQVIPAERFLQMSIRRILCIDDNDDICFLLVTLLKYEDLEAHSAQNAEDALRAIADEQFSLYILDGKLPGTDGRSLYSQIRDIDKTTPIVIYSADAQELQRQDGISAAYTFVTKPNIDGLISVVKESLGLSESTVN
jgi:DNA-binding response OmpR family regulator